ncbi:MAG: hypothetical protein IPI49_01975 [Myxococcales bacterium]|jgi:hypothetical protein|nr:hypothetical protein [Myxococcales bacterium]
MQAETLYASSYSPDPRSAVDVLAFVLTPASAFAVGGDAEELAAVVELLGEAKSVAIQRWLDLRISPLQN